MSTALILVTGGIGWFDYVTGPDLAMSLAYLVPIVAACWFVGEVPGTVTSIASGIAWFAADIAWRHVELASLSYWNGFTRLVIFVAIGQLVLLARRDRDGLARMNLRLNELLRHETELSRTDTLTGLPNSRAFYEDLTRRIEESRRTSTALCVAYLDVDNFKQVNDRYGHFAGDDALRIIARAIRESVRPTDVASRLAGDEFAIVLNEIDTAGFVAIAGRIAEQVRRAASAWPDAALDVSIGLACFHEPPSDADDAIRRADAAMYQAKRNGKGRIEMWSRSESAS